MSKRINEIKEQLIYRLQQEFKNDTDLVQDIVEEKLDSVLSAVEILEPKTHPHTEFPDSNSMVLIEFKQAEYINDDSTSEVRWVVGYYDDFLNYPCWRTQYGDEIEADLEFTYTILS